MTTQPFPDITAAVAMTMAGLEEAMRRPRFEPLPAGTFPAPSLLAWHEVAVAAGVPVVPLEEVGRFVIDTLLRWDEGGADSIEMWDRIDALHAALSPDEMLRWDCCAPLDVKQALGNGSVPSAADRRLIADDPRAWDIIYGYPAETIAVLRRPWVEALWQGSHPVEFRVFVHQGEVVAVANYYPQRDLVPTAQIEEAVRQACRYAQAMVAVLRERGLCPWMPRIPAEPQQGIEATLDFLMTPEGGVVWLESGPGFGFGAHPCTFLDPDTDEVSPVRGVRWAIQGPTVPLPAF